MSRPLVRDARNAKVAGALLLCAGAYLLYDAYEARGRSRPFAARFLPG